ncbi:16S rRNA (guanine(527)-N(7))-methyltransferase RsmG [Pseudostreptobacillus sp.]
MKNKLEEYLKISDIVLNEKQIENLIKYLDLLIETNKVMNLTAIREEESILEKHFIDSLLLTKIIREDEKNIIDIGTGAGFPGLVLSIVYPDKNFLLVDSVKKKISFINTVIEKIGLKNVKTSTERAEELIKDNREKFDVALCRGVANLRIILEYLIPFLKVHGRFLPQKLNVNELEESKNALKTLNSEIINIYNFRLPISRDERIILEIVKKSKTNKIYPRAVGIPGKKPL